MFVPSKISPARILAVALSTLLVALGLVAGGGALTAAGAAGNRVFVSHKGTDTPTCGRATSPCRTITQGLARAHVGGTVRVLPGRYHEQVVLTRQVRLVGNGATIDATGLSQGSDPTSNVAAVLVTGGASGSLVRGFRVTGAYGEGILVLSASHVRIALNRVVRNDRGTPATTPYMECAVNHEIPGDCGEGIHLMSATNSAVVGNWVSHNSGGILVTDEFGPAAHNRITDNRVVRNLYDCGITMPGHNAAALAADGTPQPTLGGVYDNLVARNRIIGNGTLGEGAGVLIAAAFPQAASYDNRIVDNVIRGNELAGVTLHAHAPNQDINGNVVAHNNIGRNNLGGDPDAHVTGTTGILVFSAVPTVTVQITIRHNHIHNNVNKIWKSANVTVN